MYSDTYTIVGALDTLLQNLSTSYKFRMNFSTFSEEDEARFLAFLKKNPSIEHFDFDKCHLNDDFISKLVDVLSNNTSLKSLILSNNQITDKGFSALTILSLESLNVAYNQITDEGIEVLHASQCKRPTLQDLRLDNNQLTDHALNFLAEMPNLNSLDILGNDFTAEGFALFLKNRTLKAFNCNGYPKFTSTPLNIPPSENPSGLFMQLKKQFEENKKANTRICSPAHPVKSANTL